jgi:hypothetical protein
MNLKYKFLRLLGYRTFDEMYKELQEGKRKEISHGDTQKSAALQRALYPKNIRYPQSGDIYLCIEDAQINYMTHWMKPYTGGDKTIFPKDEKIKISDIRQPKPTSVYCQATNADKIEELLIPQSEREQYDYNGYSLVVDTVTLNKKFKLIETDSK